MDQQEKKILKIIQRAIKTKENIGSEEDLNNYITSSLTFIVILGEIERVFDIEIPEELLEQPSTFSTIALISKMVTEIMEAE